MKSNNINELPESTAKEIIQKIRHICIFNKDLPYAKDIEMLANALSSLREYGEEDLTRYFNAGKEFETRENYENYLTDEWERRLEL